MVRVRPHVEVEPDLFVRPPEPASTWDDAPLPIIIVEVSSATSRRRDLVQKRQLYLDLSIPMYWLIDLDERNVRVVRPGHADMVVDSGLVPGYRLGELT